MNKLIIFDTTLRDGEQSPGCSMNLQEKLELARQLKKLGVDVIEAGFPAASPDDFEAVNSIARTVDGVTVCALCRCVKEDIDKGIEALKPAAKPRIHVFIATSDLHITYKLRSTREDVLKRAREMVAYAKQFVEDIEFSAEDASRSEKEFLAEIFTAAIEAGATTINIPDTVGYACPEEFSALVAYIKANVPPVTISVHCHDDLGLSVANSLAAVRVGALQVECTVNGIGERAGNAALEEIVMGLSTRPDYYGVKHNIDTKRISRTSRHLSGIIGVPVPPNKAIVGQNAFAHESGIHQHGVLSNPLTYEIMTPESVGLTESRIVLGKHSGRHAFEEHIIKLGYEPNADELESAFIRFKELCDRKKEITDRDIEALLEVRGEVNETYSVQAFVVNSGTNIPATASVRMSIGGETRTGVSVGDGPIDAAFKAIDQVTGVECTLKNYAITSVTQGEDALGEVAVKLERGGRLTSGRGLSTDIIEASIRAYINALNKG